MGQCRGAGLLVLSWVSLTGPPTRLMRCVAVAECFQRRSVKGRPPVTSALSCSSTAAAAGRASTCGPIRSTDLTCRASSVLHQSGSPAWAARSTAAVRSAHDTRHCGSSAQHARTPVAAHGGNSLKNPWAHERVLIQNRCRRWCDGRMPAPHKGARGVHTVRPACEVSDALREVAARHGLSVSQYVADLLAIHVGRPDLVRELGQDTEVLPLAM